MRFGIKYLFLISFILLAFIPGVLAYQQDFQNYDGGITCIGSTSCGILQYPYWDNKVLYVKSAGASAFIRYDTPQTATNWSATIERKSSIGNAWGSFRFYDSSNILIGTFTDPSFTFQSGISSRYDLWYDIPNSRIVVYRDSKYIGELGGVVTSPAYFEAGMAATVSSQFYVDDYIISPSLPADRATRNVIESLPNGYYIIIDAINPGNNGLYFPNGTQYLTGFYHTKYSFMTNETPFGVSVPRPIEVVNYDNGITYDTLYTRSPFDEYFPTVGRTAGNITFNISALAAAGAPTGRYRFEWDEAGYGLHTSDLFWLTIGGATVVWDSTDYPIGSPATVSWSIVGVYWDPATYSYEGNIIDAYGTVKKTWTITTQIGSELTTLDTAIYPDGVYFAEVVRTQLAAPYTEYSLGYDYTEVYTDTIIVGTTYDASAGILLPSVDVNMTQSGVVYHRISTNPGSIYNKTGLTPSNLVNLSATGKNSTSVAKMHVPVWFTPLAYGNYTINMYLTDYPQNQTHQGDAIYGLVLSTPYYEAVGGATVEIWNATHYTSVTTNATGFYIINFTAAGNLGQNYFMNATATGYGNTSLHWTHSPEFFNGIEFNATREDFLLSSMYTMTIHFVDSKTGAAIPNVTVIDSNGYSQTTITGEFVHDYPYSLVIFYYSASGYASASSSYVIDSDRMVTISLTAVATSTPVTWYTPKTISFRIIDTYGNPLVSANVNATYNSTTLPKGLDDLINNYGMNTQSANDALNGTLFMDGFTDSSGSIVFTMMSSIMYDIVVTYGGNNNTYRMYPQESIYQLKFIATTPADNLYNAIFAAGNTKVWATEPDLYNVTLWWQYQDVSGKTTRIDYYLFDVDTGTTIFTTNVTAPVSGGIYQVNFTLPNIRGKNYMWWTNYSRNI